MILGQALRLPDKIRVQKMLNRRINSCRASIACAGFIRLSTLSRRSRSIAASSRTSLLRAFHFAYLPKPMPSARSPEMIQTVMSVEVTRSIGKRKSRLGNPSEIVFLFRNKFKQVNATQGILPDDVEQASQPAHRTGRMPNWTRQP
jgi:hypothetical protein